jgi:hypothetical protein
MEESLDLTPEKKTKRIITAAKYLIKIIKRFPKEEVDDENNKKIYAVYEQLIDAILDQVRVVDA